uniref:Uncharacterized protein n=1 Tax=Timema cristinae TaxID=61476 RepID=A0A7R9CFD2_TIMCR|nr:unnamed protein product [Timema cristinae]
MSDALDHLTGVSQGDSEHLFTFVSKLLSTLQCRESHRDEFSTRERIRTRVAQLHSPQHIGRLDELFHKLQLGVTIRVVARDGRCPARTSGRTRGPGVVRHVYHFGKETSCNLYQTATHYRKLPLFMSFVLTRLSLILFQTHCLTKRFWIRRESNPGPVARNSDHYITEDYLMILNPVLRNREAVLSFLLNASIGANASATGPTRMSTVPFMGALPALSKPTLQHLVGFEELRVKIFHLRPYVAKLILSSPSYDLSHLIPQACGQQGPSFSRFSEAPSYQGSFPITGGYLQGALHGAMRATNNPAGSTIKTDRKVSPRNVSERESSESDWKVRLVPDIKAI